MTPSLAFRYVTALGEACRICNIKDFRLVHGASEEDLCRLREKFPNVPETLVQLLSLVDGTYYRVYKEQKVCIAVFDGVDGDIPYYLNSVEQMLEEQRSSIADIYGEPDPEDRQAPEYLAGFMDMVGEGIDPFQPFANMLHLSDCINNGGSSVLFIDFHPASGGVAGQIVCFSHDPDSYTVVAPSFDAFLEARLAAGFDWIEPVEDIPEDPAMTALLEGLKVSDPAAEQQLQLPSFRNRILYIMDAVQTPAVLRACLQRLEELYAIYDETAPSGYTYGPQYDYMCSQFYLHADVYLHDAALREDVAAFARRCRNVPLIHELKLEQTPEEAAEMFRDHCNWSYVQERYNTLSPEAFFKESVLAWALPSFDEYFDHIANLSRFPAYTQGTKERRFRFDPGWKDRLHASARLRTVQFAMLADMTDNEEDLERLKARLTDPGEDSEFVLRLAHIAHALCLLGEEQVDAHVSWIFEQLLTAIRSNEKLFVRGYNLDASELTRAAKELKQPTATVYDVTFLLSLRPERSLELLARIDAMLTEERGIKACAKLVRVLKKRIQEAKG